MNDYHELSKSNSIYAANIQTILNENKDKRITLNYIAEDYFKKFNRKLSLMTFSRILRYHLNYHYRKTIIKNPKIREKSSKITGLVFLNTIIRAIELNLNIIYLDEVCFSLENSNFYTWEKEGEIIARGRRNNIKNRINVIIAIDENKILNYKISTKNINIKIFIEFMKEIISKTGKTQNSSILIMDNAK